MFVFGFSFILFVGENEFNDSDYQLSNLKLKKKEKNKYGFFISVRCSLLMHINEHKCINLNKIQFSIVWLYVGCRMSDWKCTLKRGKKKKRKEKRVETGRTVSRSTLFVRLFIFSFFFSSHFIAVHCSRYTQCTHYTLHKRT